MNLCCNGQLQHSTDNPNKDIIRSHGSINLSPELINGLSAPVMFSTAAAAVLDSVESSCMYHLSPGAASACILKHLSKHDKQQFSLACKHTHVLAVATIQELCISHRWMACNHHRTTLPHCTDIVLRPRTMVELSRMSSILLLRELKRLPHLSGLQLDLKVRPIVSCFWHALQHPGGVAGPLPIFTMQCWSWCAPSKSCNLWWV